MSKKLFTRILSKQKEDVVSTIGKNHTYYVNQWTKATAPTRFSGWNWASFLAAPFWFSYRRMYGWMSLYFLVILLYALGDAFLPFLQYATEITLPYPWAGFIGTIFTLHILTGLFGNALFAKKVEKKVQKYQVPKPGYAQVPLFSQAGVSFLSALLGPLIVAMFIIYPFIQLLEWEYSPGFPKGAFVYLDEEGAPHAPWDIEENPSHRLFSSRLMLFYENIDPIENETVYVEIFHIDDNNREKIYEKSHSFFRSSSVNVALLDTGDPNLSTGEYEIDVYVGDQKQDSAKFTMVSPQS
ncbi:DUF2628 domain-containing protein [Alteribacter populi]|uniref:DUF2628 domain-containing protein n=1 Tax=Alteribacter populi TaxID=2011011 RepID=UPI000BBA82BB|nr:DUF2628 domain-containing protein [Alteribacter populi]